MKLFSIYPALLDAKIFVQSCNKINIFIMGMAGVDKLWQNFILLKSLQFCF